MRRRLDEQGPEQPEEPQTSPAAVAGETTRAAAVVAAASQVPRGAPPPNGPGGTITTTATATATPAVATTASPARGLSTRRSGSPTPQRDDSGARAAASSAASAEDADTVIGYGEDDPGRRSTGTNTATATTTRMAVAREAVLLRRYFHQLATQTGANNNNNPNNANPANSSDPATMAGRYAAQHVRASAEVAMAIGGGNAGARPTTTPNPLPRRLASATVRPIHQASARVRNAFLGNPASNSPTGGTVVQGLQGSGGGAGAGGAVAAARAFVAAQASAEEALLRLGIRRVVAAPARRSPASGGAERGPATTRRRPPTESVSSTSSSKSSSEDGGSEEADVFAANAFEDDPPHEQVSAPPGRLPPDYDDTTDDNTATAFAEELPIPDIAEAVAQAALRRALRRRSSSDRSSLLQRPVEQLTAETLADDDEDEGEGGYEEEAEPEEEGDGGGGDADDDCDEGDPPPHRWAFEAPPEHVDEGDDTTDAKGMQRRKNAAARHGNGVGHAHNGTRQGTSLDDNDDDDDDDPVVGASDYRRSNPFGIPVADYRAAAATASDFLGPFATRTRADFLRATEPDRCRYYDPRSHRSQGSSSRDGSGAAGTASPGERGGGGAPLPLATSTEEAEEALLLAVARDYLMRGGYADTLRSLDAAVAQQEHPSGYSPRHDVHDRRGGAKDGDEDAEAAAQQRSRTRYAVAVARKRLLIVLRRLRADVCGHGQHNSSRHDTENSSGGGGPSVASVAQADALLVMLREAAAGLGDERAAPAIDAAAAALWSWWGTATATARHRHHTPTHRTGAGIDAQDDEDVLVTRLAPLLLGIGSRRGGALHGGQKQSHRLSNQPTHMRMRQRAAGPALARAYGAAVASAMRGGAGMAPPQPIHGEDYSQAERGTSGHTPHEEEGGLFAAVEAALLDVLVAGAGIPTTHSSGDGAAAEQRRWLLEKRERSPTDAADGDGSAGVERAQRHEPPQVGAAHPPPPAPHALRRPTSHDDGSAAHALVGHGPISALEGLYAWHRAACEHHAATSAALGEALLDDEARDAV